MLTHEILDSQTIVELPAREMLSLFSVDYARVTILQGNANFQFGAVNLSGGQSNAAVVNIYQ